jgi:1-acyl-sn-glycerol-3-phosphate acyltransferase
MGTHRRVIGSSQLQRLAGFAASSASASLDIASEIAAGVAHPLASYGDDVDAWDPEYIARTLPLLAPPTQAYFRPEVHGLERIPDGPSLLVGNHSGGWLIVDTFLFAYAFYEHFGPERRFHQLAHDLVARNPALNHVRRYGVVSASHDNARRAFDRGAPVLVYPGGDVETFRPSWRSAEIDFDHRRGWIRLALEAGVPVVPVVAIGGQETALFVTRGRRVAHALGLDRMFRLTVLPVSIGPPLGVNVLDFPGRLPLPSKIELQVLDPIDLTERFGSAPDRDEVYDVVTGEMQDALDALDRERGMPVVG